MNRRCLCATPASDMTYYVVVALCTTGLLGFRNRTSSENISRFFARLSELGIETTAVDRDDLHPVYRATDAHVMRLTKV